MNASPSVPAHRASGKSLEEAVWRKCSRHVLPFLFAIFFFSHLNRVNLSYAAASMTEELHFAPSVYGLGAGAFFLGYFLFQIPANLVAARVGVVKIMVVLMACWGLTSMLNGMISTATQFYALRLLLGIFEAGVTPVILLFITFWFLPQHRGTAFSLFALAMPVAGALGGPISAAILETFTDVGGLSAWRWLFILEAIPTMVLAALTLRYLPSTPDSAPWLNVEERGVLRGLYGKATAEPGHSAAPGRTDQVQPGEQHDRRSFAARIILLAGTWAFFTGAYVGLFYWMPKLLHDVFSLPNSQVGWYVGGGYAALAAALVIAGRTADRSRWAREILLASLVVFALGLAGAASASSLLGVTTLFVVCMGAIGVGMSAFWSIALQVFNRAEAPLGIGVVNAMASLGSSAMLYVYGLVAEAMASIQVGLAALAISSGVAAVFTTSWYRGRVGRRSSEHVPA